MSRKNNELRSISIERTNLSQAPGSVIISAGDTRVLCTASVNTDLPPWMRDQDNPRGWVTAEYNMLPGSTPDRKRRKVDGRSTEIQRLIARVLRAGVNLKAMPGLVVTCDCDVLSADGGTRTASITGAWVALHDALAWARENGHLKAELQPLLGPVAAVSVGVIDGQTYLDLDYALDSRADVDLNVAMNHEGRFIEVQGTGEEGTFSRQELDDMLDLASGGITQLIEKQRAAIA